MKVILLLLGVFAAAQGASWNELLHTTIFPAQLDQTLTTVRKASVVAELENILDSQGHEIYSNYMEKFGKPSNRARDMIHQTVFKKNLVKVAEQNVDYNGGFVSWYKAVNQFTDMTEEEIQAKFLGYNVEFASVLANSSVPRVNPRKFQPMAPDRIDWRDYGAVSMVKNQGGCGSCVPFAAAACLESSHALWHNGQMFDLSEQELVDCSRGNGNNGCAGGTFVPTFDYLRNNGLSTEGEYPYEERDGNCRSGGKSHPARVTGWWPVEPHGNEDSLKEAVATYGPIAVALHANGDFMAYGGGIFEAHCQGGRNHAILAIGYGHENGRDFWVAKNSWDTWWGEGGFMRLRRHYGNICDIAGDAVLVNA